MNAYFGYIVIYILHYVNNILHLNADFGALELTYLIESLQFEEL